MEYVFQRYRPPLNGFGDEIFGDVLCELSMLTRKRAKRLFAALVERRLRQDVDEDAAVNEALDSMAKAESDHA